jgi:succinate dehydrogenase / fumarate reductase cytochrome b subunit
LNQLKHYILRELLSSSLGKKIAMALSGIFLMIFLLQHFIINLTSLFSEDMFNSFSHFMGTNVLVQFVLQPLLIGGVIFHFVMGIFLDYQNRQATKYEYLKEKGNLNSTWISRNMILSGVVILAFLGLHFVDFWIPEIQYKYIEFLPEDPNRYYEELVHKFKNPVRVILYCFAFILLALHLLHGFTSSIKSMGVDNKNVKKVELLSYVYSIGIPMGFCLIAIYHYMNHLL